MALSCTISKTLVTEPESVIQSESKKLLKLPDQNQYPLIRSSFKRALESKIPPLSKDTQDLIESIKAEKPPLSIFQNQICYTNPSEKYSYLLSNDKSRPLPSSYQKLTRIFRSLDQTIFFFQYNRSPLQYLKIQDAIEKTYQLRCRIEDVQQIATVYPESYKFSWNIIKNEPQLFIDYFDGRNKERDDLGKRKKQFDEMILSIVSKYHQEFLACKGYDWQDTSDWHPDFPIFSIPELSLAPLPDKPEVKVSDVSSFVTQMVNVHSNIPKNLPETVIEGTIDGLSPALAAKILAKESVLKAQRMELVESSVVKEHSQGEKVMKIMDVLRTLFSTQKTPSMFLNILVGKLSGILGIKNYRSLEDDLRNTVELFPGFLAIIKTNSGEVLRFTRLSDFKLVDARQELRIKFGIQ